MFNFKDGSPRDPEYNIRLKYALSYLIKKRTEASLELLSIYNMLICLQRTVAGASELYGDKAQQILNKCLALIANESTETESNTEASEAATIEHFKAIYNKLYGIEPSNNSDRDSSTKLSEPPENI